MQKSSPSKNIPLFNLTRVEPDADKEGCLVVEYARPQHHSPQSAAAIASKGTSKSDTLLISSSPTMSCTHGAMRCTIEVTVCTHWESDRLQAQYTCRV
jgi:hypothetical protein